MKISSGSIKKMIFVYMSMILLVIIPVTLSHTYGQWRKHIIDDNLSTAEIVRVADINADNEPDIVITDYVEDKVLWYENDLLNWTRHIIDSTLKGPMCPYVADMNGDDKVDILVKGLDEDVIVWYENNHPIWPRHQVANSTGRSTFLNAADIDGDNDMDVITSQWHYYGDVIWYENNLPNWNKHIIASNWGGVTSLQVADIDNDNNIDVAVVGCLEYKVSWFKNENAGQTWTEFPIDYDLDGAYHLSIADFNGDNKPDVVATGHYTKLVAWYDNNHPGLWIEYPLDENLSGATAVGIADINSDEKPDIVATGKYAHDVVWYKNNYPDPWDKQVIDNNLHFANHLIPADIDGDNIFDVVATGQQSPGIVVWYENLANKIYPKSVELSHKYFPPSGDTLTVKAEFNNPRDHELAVYANINLENQAYHNSLQLNDNGNNVCCGKILLKGLEEDMFRVDLSINNLTSDTTYLFPVQTHFTTAGPIKIVSFDSEIVNERVIGLTNFKLKNHGKDKTIENVRARLVTSDTCVTGYGRNNTFFGNIESGETKDVDIAFGINVSEIPNDINFKLEISSDENVYWIDSLTVNLDPTSIKDQKQNLPDEFSLEQNYPNPFNPKTTIKYSLPSVGTGHAPSVQIVKLVVYDVLGKEIAILVNEQQRPGNYEVKWDAIRQASGVYLYRLSAGKYTEARKMILLR